MGRYRKGSRDKTKNGNDKGCLCSDGELQLKLECIKNHLDEYGIVLKLGEDLQDYSYYYEMGESFLNLGTDEHALLVTVGVDESNAVPHFHVFRREDDLKAWKNGICLMFADNRYYEYNDSHETLTHEEMDCLVRHLKSKPAEGLPGDTYWQCLISLWNSNNYRFCLDLDMLMPEYDCDTISRYYIDPFYYYVTDITAIARSMEHKLRLRVDVSYLKHEVPYFNVINSTKVYDSDGFRLRGELDACRLHFKDGGMEFNTGDGFLDWKISNNDIDNIKTLLRSPNNLNGKYTNWQMACWRWNYESFSGEIDSIKDYIQGKYDEQYKDNPSYVPSTTEIPDIWVYNPSK